MLRYAALIVILGSLIAMATAADQSSKAPQPKLSDDAKKFMAHCNRLMGIDYQGEVFNHITPSRMPDASFDLKKATEHEHKQWFAAKKFTAAYLIPRSQNRLTTYVSKFSPSELRKLNDLMPITAKRLSKEDEKKFMGIMADLVKIEDVVLKETPESRYPKSD